MKKFSTLPRFFIIFFVLLQTTLSKGQDIHFSQIGNSPLNLSPALTGVFGGDLRFVGNYRSQWRSVPVPYTTFSGSVENKLYLTKGRYDKFLAAGVMINYDRQGSLHLTSLQIGIPFALTLPVARNKFLTLGATPAFGQRAFNQNKVNFGNQWDGCVFDPGINPNEDLLLQNTSLKYFDLSAGLNFRMQGITKRNRLDLGAAMHHINRPYHDFWSSTLDDPGNVRLYNKLSVYALGLVQVKTNFDLMFQGSYQQQGSYEEIVYGGGIRFHLNQKPYRELALQVGADYRSRYQDALIPHVEVLYKTWMLGVTYDVNLSNANLVTNRRGGPEVSLIYRLYKIKPLPVFKSCPII